MAPEKTEFHDLPNSCKESVKTPLTLREKKSRPQKPSKGPRIGSMLAIIALIAVLLAFSRESANPRSPGQRIARSVLAERSAKPYRLPKVEGFEFVAAALVGLLSLRAFRHEQHGDPRR